MAAQPPNSGEMELHLFAAKLWAFRDRLPPNEQHLLDTPVLNTGGESGDVEGHGFATAQLAKLRAYWLDPAQFDPSAEFPDHPTTQSATQRSARQGVPDSSTLWDTGSGAWVSGDSGGGDSGGGGGDSGGGGGGGD